MPLPGRSGSARPLGELILALGDFARRYRFIVLALAIVLEVAWILIIEFSEPRVHPLAPVGAGVTFIVVLAGGLAGALIGLAAALVAALAAFLLLADLSVATGIANAVVTAAVWCGAAVATGIMVSRLRQQVTRREADLHDALEQSQSANEQLEQILDFSPDIFQGETLAEVAATLCSSAVTTFGADGARVYALRDGTVELLGVFPPSDDIAPGYMLSFSDFPDLESMLALHRPSFVQDLRETGLRGPALRLRRELGIVSTIRLPIIGPQGPVGVIGLGWDHSIDRPRDELIAIMQRFADQAAIAWSNALRLEAQRQADSLHETLERVVALAPSFHIMGTREEVAQAICQAAVVTFECRRASLYRIEGDRLRLLDCYPPTESLIPGRILPLTGDTLLAREIRTHTPLFVPDINDPVRAASPWPREVGWEKGTRSVLYVPARFTEQGPRNLLVLSWDRLTDEPDENLLFIVERFADQLALALSNASAQRLHARLEASLLPTAPVEHPRLSVVTRYRTGEQRLRLGGDFLGSLVDPEGVLHFVLGDVSGHGPDAAALGATLRATWKALALAGEGLLETMAIMRTVLQAERREAHAFATIVIGRVDVEHHNLILTSAGHLPPLLITDEVTALEHPPTPPLGVDKGVDRGLYQYQLPDDWTLFCYTDGLIDARVSPGSSERVGEQRLKQRLAAWAGGSPGGTAVDELMSDLQSAGGRPFADDVAVLLISTKNTAAGVHSDGEDSAGVPQSPGPRHSGILC